MSTTAPAFTPKARTAVPDLPDPGPGRFWYATHQPTNIKQPMLLELREQTNTGEVKLSFSRLIAKQPTIADPKQIVDAAAEILIRAGKVDEYVGVLTGGDS